MTWRDKVLSFEKELGREPNLDELLILAKDYKMTDAEIDEQRKSWVRGMMARCEHGVLDFEQCPDCRGWR